MIKRRDSFSNATQRCDLTGAKMAGAKIADAKTADGKIEKTIEGWVFGFAGMLIFSGSLPATRAALAGFDPFFLTAARATLAGALALGILLLFRQPRPNGKDIASLTVVALGVVLGFPLLSAMALQHINAAQSQIFIGMMPLATAAFGVLRGGERPRIWFWFFAVLGSSCVIAVALHHNMGLAKTGVGFMLAAILVCGLGYAEGARLARKLGGWQVICWALVLALPLTIGLGWYTHPAHIVHISRSVWLGLGYVSLFSMLIGFVFWYRGLALAGISTVGQLQLLQPGFGLIASAIVLNETVPPLMIFVILGVMICVLGARRFA